MRRLLPSTATTRNPLGHVRRDKTGHRRAGCFPFPTHEWYVFPYRSRNGASSSGCSHSGEEAVVRGIPFLLCGENASPQDTGGGGRRRKRRRKGTTLVPPRICHSPTVHHKGFGGISSRLHFFSRLLPGRGGGGMMGVRVRVVLQVGFSHFLTVRHSCDRIQWNALWGGWRKHGPSHRIHR